MKLTLNINRLGLGIGAIVLAAGLLFSAAPASAAGYMKLGDIKGESISPDGQRLIDEYNSLAPQINQQLDQLLVMAEELHELRAGIISDKSTPKLLENAASGTAAEERPADRAVDGDADSSAVREYDAASVKLQEAVALLKDELGRAAELIGRIAEIHKPGGGSTGQSRRRGDVVLEDLTIFAQTNQQAAAIEEAVTIVGEIGTEFSASLE